MKKITYEETDIEITIKINQKGEITIKKTTSSKK